MKTTKIILLMSAIITAIAFILANEYLVAFGLMLFFGSFGTYVFIRTINDVPDDDDHYDDYYGI